MTSSARPPHAYRPGPWVRFREGLRYPGGPGQRAWLASRLAGVALLVYLLARVAGTVLVVVNPARFDHLAALHAGTVLGLGHRFDGPYRLVRVFFRLFDLALIAALAFHAIQGVRVTVLDFWPGVGRYHAMTHRIALYVLLVVMLPATILVLSSLFAAPRAWPLPARVAP